MSEARASHYELYERLGTKGGEKDMYKMAKLVERKTRNLNQVFFCG
jgi:hypothetical protein